METVQVTDGGAIEVPDPPDALTDKEFQIINLTWTEVYKNADAVGVAVLIRFFTTYPSAKQYFSKFKHMDDPEEMKKSDQLQKHARRVMNSLNSLVENLGDAEKLLSILKLLGKGHALRHKVDPVYFKYLAGVILEVLAEVYPDVVTAEVGTAWSKLLGAVYYHLSCVYRELGYTRPPSSAK